MREYENPLLFFLSDAPYRFESAITLRDVFAAFVASGIYASPGGMERNPPGLTTAAAQWSYEVADALLRERANDSACNIDAGINSPK